MNKLKKRYLAACIVVITTILVLPKYIATQVSNTLDNIVAGIDKNPVYSAQVIEVVEGWFTSTAIIKVGLNFDKISAEQMPNMPTGKAQFLVDFHASHGPVIFVDGFSLAWVKWQATQDGKKLKPIMQWDDSQPLYKITGVQQLWNDTDFQDQIQAFTIDSELQNVQAAFSGYQGKGTFSSSHFDYEADSASLKIQNDENAVSLSDLNLTMQLDGSYMEAIEGAFIDTKLALTLGKLKFEDLQSGQEIMELSSVNAEFVADVDEQNNTANVTQIIDVNSASFSGYLVQDLNMNLAVNQLSVAFMEKYQALANELTGKDPNVAQQQMLNFAQNNLLELLKHDPEIDLKNVSATLPEGKFNVDAKAQTLNVQSLPENLQDREFWLTHLLASANVQADKAVARAFATNYMVSQLQANPQTAEMSAEQISQIAIQQSPAMIDAMIQQGFLVEEGEVYKSSISLKDKEAILNGKPMPLP